jgi:rhomboid domain-containing protein 1
MVHVSTSASFNKHNHPVICFVMSNGSRFQELIQITPPITLCTIATCTILYILFEVLLDIHLSTVTFCPQLILYHGQIYRIVTSVLFHSNTIHIVMNMMSTYSLGTLLEQQIGSFRLLYTIGLSMIVTSCLSIGTAFLLSILFHSDTFMNQHSIGFSGILFHLSVLECHTHPNIRRNLFGSVEIPSYLYPWVL